MVIHVDDYGLIENISKKVITKALITTLAVGVKAAVIPPTGRWLKKWKHDHGGNRHFSTLTSTVVETNTAAVTANRQAEHNVPPTVLQGTNPPAFPGRYQRRQKHTGNRTWNGNHTPLDTQRGTRTPWSPSYRSCPYWFTSSSARSSKDAGDDHGEYCT
ncbi:hypothetical protein NDU88_006363 [Pleurodeles waltl]|uniref:Uncharacterized protein n=1 Tax=Pleurodeles waltl TaxID=8319 RepID=A0AAV7PR48_PLEWA|nr:hypothetical protein NDU88_006363 [Pleurodeles waltl]